MSWLLKGLLRPTQNRHYVGPKLHFLRYILNYLPIFLVLMVLAVWQSSWLFLLLLMGMIALVILDYFVFDAISDRLLWSRLFKRHYDYVPDISDEHHAVMKDYEKNPTTENLERIKKLKEE